MAARRILTFVVFLGALLAAHLPLRADGPSSHAIPLTEVQPGQRGYGLSVFSGTRPERFDVEVLGVLRNPSPDTSYILARLSAKNLEETGVVAGMSGSPVYIDGRLAGAVAFAWPFAQEAIAGITPIEPMRRLRALGQPGWQPAGSAEEAAASRLGPGVAPPAADLLDRIVARDLPADLLERELRRLAPPVAAGGTAAIQWTTSGFGETTQALLRRSVGGVAPAGAATGPAPELVAGGAVAGVLVDGDLRLAMTGTITDRTGDEVLALGHPFLGAGPVLLPMAPAEVITVISSRFSSFKIASFGEPIGAFDQDRLVGLRGKVGLKAPTLPLSVRVGGRTFHMRLAQMPQITPLLLAISTLASVETSAYVNGPQSMDLELRLRLAGYGDLLLEQSFDGDRAALDSATFVLAVASFLVQNRLEKVAIEEVELQLEQAETPRSAVLVGAHAERTLVRPGERIGLNLDLAAYRGEPFRRTLAVDLPADLPNGRYSLLVGDGASIDAARFQIEPPVPVSFPQALDLLRSLHSTRELVVLGVHGGHGLAVAGKVMPRLPGSVRSIWSAAASGSAVPLRLAVAQQQAVAVDVPVSGAVRIDLEVRRREPLAPEPPAGEAAAAPPTAATPPASERSESDKSGPAPPPPPEAPPA